VRTIPHTKATAFLFRDDRFDPDRAKRELSRIPTLAGAIMHSNIEVLQEAGLLPKSDPRPQQAPAPDTASMLDEAAQELATFASAGEPAITQTKLQRCAQQMEPAITQVLMSTLERTGGRVAGG